MYNLPPYPCGLWPVATEDQKQHYEELQQFYKLVSQCWHALHNGEDDPLVPLRKSKRLNKATYDYIWRTVIVYERLWELVQVSFVHIQPKLMWLTTGPSRESAFGLFNEILHETSCAEFSICMEVYVECPSRRQSLLESIALKIYLGESLLPHEENWLFSKQAQRLIAQRSKEEAQSLPLYCFVLHACEQVSKKESIVKERLEDLSTAWQRLARQEHKMIWHQKSFAWKNGKRGEGDKSGIYKFS